MDKLETLAQQPEPGDGPAGPDHDESQVFEQYTNLLDDQAERLPSFFPVAVEELEGGAAAPVGRPETGTRASVRGGTLSPRTGMGASAVRGGPSRGQGWEQGAKRP